MIVSRQIFRLHVGAFRRGGGCKPVAQPKQVLSLCSSNECYFSSSNSSSSGGKRIFSTAADSDTKAPLNSKSNSNSNSRSSGRSSSASSSSSSSSNSNGNPSNNSSSGVADLNPPRGTRDFYPADQQMKQWLFGKWRHVAESFGFEEYDAPVVENTGLYTRKGGDEIVEQIYCFQDKSGRNLSLRPEMTPSLARMVMATHSNLSFPIKWYSIPQCWRYERMSRGRRREHYQLNMDIWGIKGADADAEILAIIVALFKELGLTSSDVGLQISNRTVVDSLMDKFAFPKDSRDKCFNIIDKMDKVSQDDLISEFITVGVDSVASQAFLDVLKLDVNQIKQVLGNEDKAIIELEKLFSLCSMYGIQDWVHFNAAIVRGLSYYSGTVFEGFDRSKQFRAICGGGRYDNLTTSLGYNHAIPAVGFGFGDAVIIELLKEKKLLPDFSTSRIDISVFAYDSALANIAIQVSSELRSLGLAVDMNLDSSKKAKWAMQRANKLGIDHVILVNSEDIKSNSIVVRDMKNNVQETIQLDKLRTYFHNIIKIK